MTQVLLDPALNVRSKVLSIKDRRNRVGKLVFKLASLGSEQTFTLVAPELSVPGNSVKSPTYQPATNLSEYIATQVPFQATRIRGQRARPEQRKIPNVHRGVIIVLHITSTLVFA